MGTSIASSLLNITINISSRVTKELRNYGANILIEPKLNNEYLDERDLIRIKSIFWRHNIIGFAPYLYGIVKLSKEEREYKVIIVGTWFKKRIKLYGDMFITGVRTISPWWKIEGEWLKDNTDTSIMIGSSLAKKLNINIGDYVNIKRYRLKIVGIITTGGFEDNMIFLNLGLVQKLLNLDGKISKVLVSAMTVPMDSFGKMDPEKMSKKDFDKWYCTAYVTSVAHQLEEVFKGGRARPIWYIADTEGKILSKLKFLMILLTIISILGGGLGISASITRELIKRRKEVGLMKAIGGDRFKILYIFLSGLILLAILGGFIGYILGIGISNFIGLKVFGKTFGINILLLPITIGIALLITILSGIIPLKKEINVSTISLLRI
jgi:putative ABC transport system permease protein